MSNLSKDHPSIRVFAPPGGRTANIFGVPEPEVPTSTKKNHMESDIFGCKSDNTDTVTAKQNRPITNNIFGNPPEQQLHKTSIYSEKNKSSIFAEPTPSHPSSKPDRQRSTIFATDEPVQSAPARPVSEKYKSSIFSNGDDDTQGKRQQGARHGLRVGYNPINGESYSTKDGLNSKVEQTETTENGKESDDGNKTPVQENGNDKPEENGHTETAVHTNGNGHIEPSNEKQTNGTNGYTNGQSTAKNGHTSVRIAHPPGGRSNGPLW